ncbi:hypothetical protein CDL12_00566 [Handroanthus impetiginosus]|uniref:DOG1 domain-containing protein n=1 Tax=Handroanthus impetiginosus TaxID=429701 RepID=A0A2G9IA89_9LAMI|nr:hypothetical protein CDL12_00566 [Handroanthus impetiginosus]
MLKSALFGRKKTTVRPFTDFYNEWLATLATTLLPQLRRILSSFTVSSALLSVHVDALHHHFHSYYVALDKAAAVDVAQCLYPEWRSSLEKPFLWLGDFHPYLFTNLLRSFLDDQEQDEEDEEDDVVLDRPWDVAAAWRSPSKALTTRVDQIECGLRLMVPALAARARHAQTDLVKNVAGVEGVKEGVENAVMAEMEELVGVVVDANRLRRSVLADVLSVTSVYQAALFLEAVAQFFAGFRDEKLLKEFEKCEKTIN